jgi:hypothetical protein
VIEGTAEGFDWVHPSWRDLVIEHLVQRPGSRERFLSRCGIAGLELALSSAGGREGERSQPLLQTPEDWGTLRRRALELIGGGGQPAHHRLLSTLRSLLFTAGGEPGDGEVHRLAREVLPAVTAAWNAAGEPLRPDSLRLFYDVSVMVRPLAAGPSLEATWEQHEPMLADPSSIEWHGDIAEALVVIEVIARNEPRLLRQRRWPHDFAPFAEAVEALAKQELQGTRPLLEALQGGDVDSTTDVSEAADELSLWSDLLGRLKTVTGRDVAATRAALDAAVRALSDWWDDYQEQMAEEARMEAEYADDYEDEDAPEDPNDSVQAIFTDL